MRYANVQTQIWADERFRALPLPARLMFLYLLTSPHSNMCGYFLAPVAYVAYDTGYPTEEVSKALVALVQSGMVDYDDGAGVVLIRNYLLYNPVKGPKQLAGALARARQMPKGRLLPEFVELAKAYTHSSVWDELLIGYQYRSSTSPIAESESEPETVSGTDVKVPDAQARKPATPRKRATPAFGDEAKALAQALYDWLNATGDLPSKRGWFAEQAAYAEAVLLKDRPLEQWLDCLAWAMKDPFWSGTLDSLKMLGSRVWSKYHRAGQPKISKAAFSLSEWLNEGEPK